MAEDPEPTGQDRALSDPAQEWLRAKMKVRGHKVLAAELEIAHVTLLRAASGAPVRRTTARFLESVMALPEPPT